MPRSKPPERPSPAAAAAAATRAYVDQLEAVLRATRGLADLGRIAGGVAHDFNNVLAAVLGNLELLEHRRSDPADPAAQRDLALIARASAAVQRATALTSGLLSLARPAQGGSRPTDAAGLVGSMAELLQATLGRRIRLAIEIAPDVGTIEADPSRLQAALLALCLNARDATPDGGEVRITLDTAEGGAMVRLCVADTGTGMAPEVLARAPDPFFTTKGTEAAGLGLSEVAALAREGRGRLELDSTQGSGTTACLLLPHSEMPAG